jgi:hypothetical protein
MGHATPQMPKLQRPPSSRMRAEPLDQDVLSPSFLDNRRRTAEHIALEASRLQSVALANDHQFLAFLTEMVILEAWREATGETPISED